MQRSHERDLIGHILSKKFNGMHVCLPAEHERNHPYVFAKAKPGWEVPRLSDSSHGTDGGPKRNENWYDFRQEGEALWKNRFSVEKLRQLQSGMTSHVAAGQYQQRPTAREGGLFKRAWFDNKVRVLPEASLEQRLQHFVPQSQGMFPDHVGIDALDVMGVVDHNDIGAEAGDAGERQSTAVATGGIGKVLGRIAIDHTTVAPALLIPVAVQQPPTGIGCDRWTGLACR